MPAKDSSRNWQIRVKDIIECVARIQRYTKGMNYEQFSNDSKTIDAVIRNLEIIGEAAGYIPASIQEKYPNLAWLEMRGMRNIIIHEYFGVSLQIIWHTILTDLSPLAEGMSRILDDQQ